MLVAVNRSPDSNPRVCAYRIKVHKRRGDEVVSRWRLRTGFSLIALRWGAGRSFCACNAIFPRLP